MSVDLGDFIPEVPLAPLWLKALTLSAALGAVVGGVWLYGEQRYQAGVGAERGVQAERHAAELQAANAEIVRLSTAARAAESWHANTLSDLSQRYQVTLKNAQERHSNDLAAVRTGALRLRDPDASLRFDACRGPGAAPGAGAGGLDGAAPGELSRAAAAFLLAFAADADGVAEQLSGCQAVITADRMMGDEHGR